MQVSVKMLQFSPTYPGGHRHSYSPTRSAHICPIGQVTSTHSLILISHVYPSKPIKKQ